METFINVHLNNDDSKENRFDCLLTPNASIATLSKIEHSSGAAETFSLDGVFPDRDQVCKEIRRLINNCLEDGRIPNLMISNLIYNSEANLKLCEELKSEFNGRIRIVMGGQLAAHVKYAYQKNKNIDIVAVGDAEVLIPQMLRNNFSSSLYEGYLRNNDKKPFAGVSYDNYYMLNERLAAQQQVFGKRQLSVQGPGGPGCSWAANNRNGACSFCGLRNIDVASTPYIGHMLCKNSIM